MKTKIPQMPDDLLNLIFENLEFEKDNGTNSLAKNDDDDDDNILNDTCGSRCICAELDYYTKSKYVYKKKCLKLLKDHPHYFPLSDSFVQNLI